MLGVDVTDCPCCRVPRCINPSASAANLPHEPSPLHMHRPLHLLRQPSIGPPSFDDDVAPPLLTPPPNYDDLSPSIEVRSGYFDMESSSSGSDVITPDEEPVRPSTSDVTAFLGELGEDDDDDEDPEDRDIVDMVGLEDLNLGLRRNSPVRI
jgi:hypothetical protein